MKLTRRHIKRGRIEVIPMIDTIMLLLIFYMTFSTLGGREKSIDAQVPAESVSGRTVIKPNRVPLTMYLHVYQRDHIVVNGNEDIPYDLTQLRGLLHQYNTVNQEITVVITGEPTTPYQAIVGALDTCAMANLTRVAFQPITPQGKRDSTGKQTTP